MLLILLRSGVSAPFQPLVTLALPSPLARLAAGTSGLQTAARLVSAVAAGLAVPSLVAPSLRVASPITKAVALSSAVTSLETAA